MTLPTISPERAAELVKRGEAKLVDIREADERARAHIPGSAHLPLSGDETRGLEARPGQKLLFHCASGNRTSDNAEALAARAAGCEAYMVEGGLQAWRKAGLPVEENKRAPLPLMQQVQITAGGLALAGTVLGALVHPAFHAISGIVGAGLIMAGLTGLCPMARALGQMPWNRRTA